MKSHTRIGVAALAALAMFAVACSDDDKSTSGGDTATTAATGEVGKNDAAIALLPEAIASKGKLLVATDATYPPSEYIAEDGSTIIGFDIDLMVALGQALGLEVEFQNASFDTIIPGLDSGQFDVGASSFTDNKEREQTVDFVTYFLAGQNFYVAANSDIVLDGIESLCGHSVAMQKGTIQEEGATAQNDACLADGKEGVEVLSFDSQTDANVAVSSGRAEVGFGDSQLVAWIAAESDGEFRVEGTPFDTAPYGFAVAKNGLAPALLEALKGIIADGTYMAILEKWGMADGAIGEPVINGALS